MEMDSFTVIAGTIILACTFGPIAYLFWFGNQREKKMKRALKEIEQQHKLLFAEQEIWNDKAFGLDMPKRMFLFINLQKGAETKILIDLSKVQQCEVSKTADIISLAVTYKGSVSQIKEKIVIFDTQYDDPLSIGFHSLKAQKWATSISKLLSTDSKRPKKAA